MNVDTPWSIKLQQTGVLLTLPISMVKI